MKKLGLLVLIISMFVNVSVINVNAEEVSGLSEKLDAIIMENNFTQEQFEEMDEEMTVELELDDGTNVTCAIITILEVEGKDYIVLMPLDENGQNDDGEVWFYRYSENPNDPNEEPQLDYIDDDAEYEKVEEAFDEYLDSCEFDELVTLDGEANE